MAGKKNSMLKNIFVAVLFVCVVIQTDMLWLDGNSSHNFFYYLFEQPFAKSITKGPVESIEPKNMAVGSGNNSFKLLYGTDEKIDSIISGIIQKAVSQSEYEELPDFLWQECLGLKCAVYEFGITVPFNEYFTGIGISESKVPKSMSGFTSIAVLPADSENNNSKVYFIDESSNGGAAVVYTSDISSELSNEIDNILSSGTNGISCISTAASGFNIFKTNIFVPQFSSEKANFYSIKETPCIDLTENVTKDYIEDVTEQYFSSYSNKTVSFEPSGVYTVADSTNVVKCYPYGVLEYFNYSAENLEQQQSLSSAYYICKEFLKKDTSIKTDYYLSDIRITGEGALFCFDYCVSDLPVILDGDIKSQYGIDHAMEVLVSGNNVRKFKKYNSNFSQDTAFKENAYTDFLTAVNYSMVLKGGDNNQIDEIIFGYYVNDQSDEEETDKSHICWFVNIDTTVYIINAEDGSLRIK